VDEKRIFALFAVSVVIIALGVNVYSIMFGVFPRLVGGDVEYLNEYARIYAPETYIFPVVVNSTGGETMVPVRGKITVFVPQYVKCPDICHLETLIMLGTFQKLHSEGILDRFLFVSVEVDPWSGSLEAAREYIEDRAGLLGFDPPWIWVFDDNETLRVIWQQLGIRVERDPITGLVIHTAGFYIVDDKGRLMYVVAPKDEGWRNPDKVAEGLSIILRKMALGEEINAEKVIVGPA